MRRLAPVLLATLAILLIACRSKAPQSGQSETGTDGADAAAAAAVVTPAPIPLEPLVTPTPEPEPEPEPEPPVAPPVRLRIPRINVNARIIPVGVNRYGEMDSPNDAWSVAWYAPGYKPWESGNAVLAGHVDYINVGPAVFWNLKVLAPGDRLVVVAEDNQEYQFEVKEIQRYYANNAPIDRIFGPNPNRGLNLVTCGGVFNPRTHEYDQRIVVYTEAVPPDAQ